MPMTGEHGSPSSRLAWTDSAAHRTQLRQMLVQLAGDRKGDLCVWGAGPCNDLDLETLLRYYRHITLLDLDSATLNDALRNRQLDQSPQVTGLGGIDLAGVQQLIGAYHRHPGPDALACIQQAAATHRLDSLGQFDVLVSTCLLSQIFIEVVNVLDQQPQQMIEILQILRQRHLELMLQHTRPGGAAILVTDVTSSDALPELRQPNADLDRLLRDSICRGNHFHGLNPLSIYQAISSGATTSPMIKSARVSQPWIWNATARRYCCLAFLMIKKQD